MNQDFYYDSSAEKGSDDNSNAGKIGFSLACFIISLINLCCCLCSLSSIAGTLSIIFGAVALATKRGGKGYAIAGIIISAVSLCAYGASWFMLKDFEPDIKYFVKNTDALVEQYDKDGSIPERFEKYRDSQYDKYWKIYDCDSFDEFYAKLIKDYKNAFDSDENSDTSRSDRKNSSPDKKDDDGEELVDLAIRAQLPV